MKSSEILEQAETTVEKPSGEIRIWDSPYCTVRTVSLIKLCEHGESFSLQSGLNLPRHAPKVTAVKTWDATFLWLRSLLKHTSVIFLSLAPRWAVQGEGWKFGTMKNCAAFISLVYSKKKLTICSQSAHLDHVEKVVVTFTSFWSPRKR